MSDPAHRQHEHRVRFDWGPTGGAALAAGTVVVVDVLSFSTAVAVAAERGIAVRPSASRPVDRPVDRPIDRAGGLSPAAMAGLPYAEEVVLASPNGATISVALAGTGATVVAGCLRNRSAVATWLRGRSGSVAVVAAGERWRDGSLRPCAEDLWGAGAVLALLPDADLSTEARLAADAFRAADLPGALHACASGLELTAAGYAADVALAAELDVSAVVPVLADGVFRASV